MSNQDNQNDQTEADRLREEAWEANKAIDTVTARIVHAHDADDAAKELALRQQYEVIEEAAKEIKEKRKNLEQQE